MRALSLRILAAISVLLAQPALAQLTPSTAPCPAYTSPDIQAHIQNAYRIAGKDIYPGLIPTMFTLPRADLVPNTLAYETTPLVKATGFRVRRILK